MSDVDRIRKLLANIKSGEKGWRKTLATAEGSFSKKLAEENLRRLQALRQTLLSQLNTADSHRRPVIEAGIITDDMNESIADRLARPN